MSGCPYCGSPDVAEVDTDEDVITGVYTRYYDCLTCQAAFSDDDL